MPELPSRPPGPEPLGFGLTRLTDLATAATRIAAPVLSGLLSRVGGGALLQAPGAPGIPQPPAAPVPPTAPASLSPPVAAPGAAGVPSAPVGAAAPQGAAPPATAEAGPAPSAPPASTGAATASPSSSAPATAAAPGADEEGEAGRQAPAGRLSGREWKTIADEHWPGSVSVETLSDAFRPKAQAFLQMLTDNRIEYSISATLRPPERSYLFHYCLEVASGRMPPKDVPAMSGVDINWDHGDAAKSREAAQAMADAFGLVGVAAHPSNHNGGDAMDMKMNFTGNAKEGKHSITYTVDGVTHTRELQVDDEAVIGRSASGKRITDIGTRELSKAGADYGVLRSIDSDIVHWSLTGR